MIQLRLLEQYQELIECHPSQVSCLWKYTAIIAYAICIPSSYFFSVIFYYFWNTICGGKCYIWAQVNLVPEIYKNQKNTSHLKDFVLNDSYDWVKDIEVNFGYPHYCPYLHFISLVSCSFSMIMMVMFIICGKGGYGINLFISPWRITYAAFVCNLIMMITTGIAVNTFTIGFILFAEQVYACVFKLLKMENHMYNYKKFCEIFQKLIRADNLFDIDACEIYSLVQTSGWMMTWTWVAGFFITCLRIIMCADFELIDIKIYAIAKQSIKNKLALNKILKKANFIKYESKEQNKIIDDNKETKKVL